jgi:microcystin-dependent protein
MAQPFVGQILAVGFNFAPNGWFLCQGQLVPIAQYDALYNLIGTTYGGDGTSTFALPNLCGRVVINQGQGPKLSNYLLGQISGSENVTLVANQNGAHSHGLLASSKTGTTITPGATTALAQNDQALADMYSTAATNTSLAPGSIGPAGGSQPHENRQPFMTLNYIIAWAGVYPSQG